MFVPAHLPKWPLSQQFQNMLCKRFWEKWTTYIVCPFCIFGGSVHVWVPHTVAQHSIAETITVAVKMKTLNCALQLWVTASCLGAMYPMLLRIRNIVYHQQINNIYRLNALVLRSWVVVLLSGPFHHQTMIAVHIVQVPPSALHLLHVFASAFFICILQNCLFRTECFQSTAWK